MKTFTSFRVWLMLLMMGFILHGPISQAQDRDISREETEMMKQRRELSPNAQTQMMPTERRIAKSRTHIEIPVVNGAMATIPIQLDLTVDNYPGEASYNLWSYDYNSYWWAEDQTFTSAGELQTHILDLFEGSSFDVECYDTWGDGGISGVVTNTITTWPLTSWGAGDYGSFGAFNFIVGPGTDPTPPVPDPVTSFPYMEDFESGAFPGTMIPIVGDDAGLELNSYAATNSNFGAMFEGNLYTNWFYPYSTADEAFASTTHVASIEMEIVPSGEPGNFLLEFDLRQAYSFNPNYEWFRVSVDGVPIADVDGNFSHQATTPNSDPAERIVYNLNAFAGAPFHLTIENAAKYYFGYYNDGDLASLDNFKMYYLIPGDIEGHVLNGGGQTIAGAVVSIDGIGEAVTDFSGYYFLGGVPSGNHNVYCNKVGYNVAVANVNVPEWGIVTQDFTLTSPSLTVTPLIFDENLHPDEIYTTFMSLLNTGDGPVDFTAAINYPLLAGADLPNVENDVVEGTTEHSIGLAPAGVQSGNVPPVFLNIDTFGDNIGYMGAPGDDNLYSMDMATYTQTLIGSSAIDPSAGDFLNDDDQTFYVTTNWGVNLASVDITTGVTTPIAAITGNPAGMNVSGMSCDPVTGTMYVAFTNVSQSQIGTIDVATGVVTLIGTPTSVAPGLIGIAIDATGQMYGWGIVNDASYLIDKANGAFGMLGPLGFDANYGQGGGFNNDDGVIYLTAYNAAAGPQLRALDPVTGGTALMAALTGGQVAAFGVPRESQSGGGVEGWLTLSDYSGNVAPLGGTVNDEVTFNAEGTVAGEVYYAEILIGTDPFVGQITIPVTMTIGGDPLPIVTDFTAELVNQITGEVSLLWNQNRDVTLEYYVIYRDGVPLTTTTDNFYTDMLPDFGVYDYELQPIYLEGDGVIVGPETVEWFQPMLCWTPFNPENSQWPEVDEHVMLYLENCNDGTLEFSFPDYAARELLNDPKTIKNDNSIIPEFANMGEPIKGEIDPSDNGGHPIILGAGGPDAFENIWIDSDEDGGPVYNWIDISATGTLVGGLADDNTVGPFPISFDFPFYGETKNQFWIGSNGAIIFKNQYVTLGNMQIPTNSTTYNDMIAWCWDDLDPANANTSVWYEDFGSYLVITFDNYYEYPDGGDYITAQMIIYANGGIIINYDYVDAGFDILSNTVGIQSSTPSMGLQVSYNTSYIHAGLAVYMGPSSSSFITEVNPAFGTIEAGETMDITMTYSSVNYEVGDYNQDLMITTNELPINEWSIPNTMHVMLPGMYTGTVTECNTGVGMEHVTVMATDGVVTYYGETDANGNYEMFVDAGVYDISFIFTGYQTVNVFGVAILDGETVTVDAALCENPYPVSGVWADPNEADTECLVTWNIPSGPYTIIYDDGSAEDYVAWIEAGGAAAVKFTPAGYPAIVTGGSVYVGDGFFPEGGSWLGTEMSVGVIAADGVNGMPGTTIDSTTVTVNNYGWVNFSDMLFGLVMEGDFYIVMWQLGTAPDVAPVGVDQDIPTVYRSYAKQAGGEWSLSPYQDFMIRAIVDGPTGAVTMNSTTTERVAPPRIPEGMMGEVFIATGPSMTGPGLVKHGTFEALNNEASRGLTQYNIFRMNGFDPDAGQTPADGTATGIGSSNTNSKNDTQWGVQPAGFYGYAVEAEYDNGDLSTWAYSNIVAHLMDNVVTITATQCDGGEPSDVDVTLVGHNFPYDVFNGTSGADGVVTFDSVIDGVYDIIIAKVAYQTIFMPAVAIFNDYSLDVVLQENAYPARNLYVEALTSVATWDEALIIQLEPEMFEDNTFPPAGWTSISTDPGSIAAWQRWNEYTGSWPIPPQYADGTSSWFAAAISDADSGHDGSNDLLVTPVLDLRESDSFVLYFDSFFDGAYGQQARVEYSTDGGITWDVLQEMVPVANTWTENAIDLAALSGITAGNDEIWIAFHSDDLNTYAGGWAVDNITVRNGPAPILGYYVYLDDGFVTQTAVDVRTYTFRDLVYGVEYTASVRALYACGLSDPIYYTWNSTYLHPPRNLGDEYIYNTNEVPLMWNPPVMGSGVPLMAASELPYIETASDLAEVDVNATPRNIPSDRAIWDIQYGIDLEAITGALGNAGAESDGEFIYATRWASSLIEKFLPDGTFVEEFSIPGVSGLRDLAYDGTYFYGAAANTTVYQMDFTTQTLVSSFTAPTAVRSIAYDDDMGGFWGNNWDSDLVLFDMTGATLATIAAPPSMYGSAYDNFTDGGPFLWVFSGTTSGGGCQVEQMDIATGTLTGVVHSVSDDFGSNMIAGGLYITEDLIAGFRTLGGTAQGDIAFGYEIADYNGGGGGDIPAGLSSFKLYRNGDFLDDVPYAGQAPDEWVNYVDNPVDPGVYGYDVSAVYDLEVFGFPGDFAESMWEGTDIVEVIWGYSIPFFEGWDQGSLDFQAWRTNDDNWQINPDVGNDEPSAEFSWDPLLEDYATALTTNPLNADMFTEGSIFVDFDLKLADRNGTGAEMLAVEVKNAMGNWVAVETFSNTGSFDFTPYHLDITNVAMGNVFQVRFNAMGTNSFDVISWYVDNIHVYRQCAAPYDLRGDYLWNDIEDLGAEVCWNAPDIPLPIAEWINWDSGEAFGGIGLNSPGPWSVAARWDAGMLSDYDGTFITKIRFFPNDDGYNSFTVKIWTGANAGTLVAEQLATGVVTGAWNEVTLDTPVMLNAADELWIGYTVDQSADGVFPAGNDAGPAIAGYGDKVSMDGATWDNLSDFGLDYNWNVQAFVEEMTTSQPAITPLIETPYNSVGSSLVQGEMRDTPVIVENDATRDFTGFNLYRMEEGSGTYELIETIPYVEGQLEYCYFDPMAPESYQTGFFYQVTANWSSDTDDCESDPAMDVAVVNDYVYVFITSIDDPTAQLTQLYPNPATNRVNITSSQEITKITVINYVGQVVYMSDLDNETMVTLNTASYENGVYVVQLDTESGIITKRVVIAQ